MTTEPSLPEQLEAIAKRLRDLAASWCASGEAPHLAINGTAQAISALSYIDLIEDASALEADAHKLRTIFQ